MKNVAFLIVFLLSFGSLKADCTFQSFVVGTEFSIGNLLEWSTTYELNNQMFQVEKSLDNVEFSVIGTVESLGDIDEETQTYRFMDLDARKGKAYYRIKQVDFSGDFSYSSTTIVDKLLENNFMITSINSSLERDIIDVTFDIIKDAVVTCQIKDVNGDVLSTQDIVATAGLNDFVLEIDYLSNGIYHLELVEGDEVERLTFNKSRKEEKVPVAQKN